MTPMFKRQSKKLEEEFHVFLQELEEKCLTEIAAIRTEIETREQEKWRANRGDITLSPEERFTGEPWFERARRNVLNFPVDD